MLFDNYSVYSVFRILIIIIGTHIMVSSTAEYKYDRKTTAGVLALTVIYMLAATCLLIYWGGYVFFMRSCLVTFVVPCILVNCKLAKATPAKIIFNHATHVLISAYCLGTVVVINTSLWNSALVDFVLLLTVYSLVILFEYRFIRRPYLRIIATMERGFGILSLIPCSMLVLLTTLAGYPVHYAQNPLAVKFIYLLGIVIIVVYAVIFVNLYIQYRYQLEKHNMELLEMQVDSLKERLSINEAAAENARIDRHDTRHKFQIVSSFLENNETQKAIAYINMSLSQLNNLPETRYCSNPVLNNVLSSYLRMAEKEHIQIETYISFPEEIPVDDMELAIVFANALENAIHACIKLPENKRRIVCKCIHNPTLMIEISNPYTGTVHFSDDNLPVTDEIGHGFGTRSIAAFCKKNDALCRFEAENNWFNVKIAL